MYEVHFYKDKNGNQPVLEYVLELSRQTDKDSRIKLNKIRDYVKALSKYGLQLEEPYIKHLDGDIWELRPLRDRILFVAWQEDGGFVLLHQFVKKTQKTPAREIKKAKANITIFWKEVLSMTNLENNPAIGQSWDEIENELFTPEEIAASDLRVAIIGEIIKARNEKGISQKRLEEMSGVKQPVIARMERGITIPQLDTVLKVLYPLGKTLAIVPLEENNSK